ncbi:MAG TPA: hypothetical protein VGM03_18365 [Phycisphaerae bacterium]
MVEAAQRYHAERRAEPLRELLEPQVRTAIMELLEGVDQVASANDVLQARLKARLGEGVAARLDRSGVANAVGPFSPAARVIDEKIDGQRAVVTYQIADRLPLSEVNLVLGDDRWLIQSDQPIPGLAAEMRNLAEALRIVADRVESDKLDADGAAKELELRQRPVLDRIAALTKK